MAQVCVLLMPVEAIIQKRQMDHLKLPARLLQHVRCCNKTKRIPPMKRDALHFTRNNSHDLSSETVNTCNSRLTASQMCGFLHVRGPAAGAKPFNTIFINTYNPHWFEYETYDEPKSEPSSCFEVRIWNRISQQIPFHASVFNPKISWKS